MTPHRGVATVVVTTLLAGLATTACSAEQMPVTGEAAPGIDATSIDDAVRQFLDDTNATGATVAVSRGGRLVLAKGYGYAHLLSRLPMQPWHRGRIGSVSKIITTIGLLQLLEGDQGDLGSLATGSDLDSGLTRKLYGHPGTDFDSPDWPAVNGPTLLNDPEVYWASMRTGVQNAYPDTFETEMVTAIEWGSALDARHLLTHTASYIPSGDPDAAEDYFGPEWDGSYSQIHQFQLSGEREGDEGGDSVKCWLDGQFYVDKESPAYTGQDYVLPPLLNPPGTKECYSNHGFGVAGMAIGDISGIVYPEYAEQHILDPLGLTDVVPKNTDISDLDAWPHGSTLDPEDVNLLGTAAGGWSASAKDMVRIMCGLDRTSNHLRLLKPQTVTTMETVPFPAASQTQPLGWDWVTSGRLYKNGIVGGGRSVAMKYLPGEFDAAPDDEINVVVNVNSDWGLPPDNLLTSIAGIVAGAGIPDDYDLFDPAYACVVEEELGLVNPTPAPTPTRGPTLVAPSPTRTASQGPTLVAPSPTRTAGQGPTVVNPTRTRPVPPTVSIRSPLNGRQPAPSGAARIEFSGLARDAAGTAIPGTRYRWTATEAGSATVLCAGSDFGPPPTTSGGLTALVDCTEFTRTLNNSGGGEGPSITIRLEARDMAGTIGTEEVIIALYTAQTQHR